MTNDTVILAVYEGLPISKMKDFL